MTPRQRKPWSKVIEESGISVGVYEREPGGPLHREVWVNGARERKALGHADRALAEKQIRELARRLAELQFAGNTGPITFGQLSAFRRLWASERRHLPARTWLQLVGGDRCRSCATRISMPTPRG